MFGSLRALSGRLVAGAAAAVLVGSVAPSAVAATHVDATGDTGGAHAERAGNSSASGSLDDRWYAAAPYLMPLDNSAPDATEVMAATNQKTFQLAFILADGNSCSPAWDGEHPVSSDTAVAEVVDNIRAEGGDVSVSVGGYGGTKLGQTCGSIAATADAYQQVVDKYDLKAIDFDLEEPEYEHSEAIRRELGAAQALQEDNSDLYISVTLPGTVAGGTGWFGEKLLDQAKSLGFTPDNYSIMPFDGGYGGDPAKQITAAKKFHGLLMEHFGWGATKAWRHEGMSLMNGRTDNGGYFDQSDFQTVLDFALDKGMARYTFWSVNRDRECTPPDNGHTEGNCSSVEQEPWEFTTYTVAFAEEAPPEPPGDGDGDGDGDGNGDGDGGGDGDQCAAVSAWEDNTAYVGGDVVAYEGHTYEAKWWNYGAEPDESGVWVDQGPCETD